MLRLVSAEGSFVLLRLNGLWFWKKPLFFLKTRLSGLDAGSGSCFTGDALPLVGAMLDREVGLEYSLCESRLEGLAETTCELRSDGGPVRQSMVMPSIG